MEVRFINNSPMDKNKEMYPDLIPGNIYRPLGMEGDFYRIIGMIGKAYLYHKSRFEVVDDTPGPGWETVERDGVSVTYDESFMDDDFFVRYFNGEQQSVALVKAYAFLQLEIGWGTREY